MAFSAPLLVLHPGLLGGCKKGLFGRVIGVVAIIVVLIWDVLGVVPGTEVHDWPGRKVLGALVGRQREATTSS